MYAWGRQGQRPMYQAHHGHMGLLPLLNRPAGVAAFRALPHAVLRSSLDRRLQPNDALAAAAASVSALLPSTGAPPVQLKSAPTHTVAVHRPVGRSACVNTATRSTVAAQAASAGSPGPCEDSSGAADVPDSTEAALDRLIASVTNAEARQAMIKHKSELLKQHLTYAAVLENTTVDELIKYVGCSLGEARLIKIAYPTPGVTQVVQQLPNAVGKAARRRGSSPGTAEMRRWMEQHAAPTLPTPEELVDVIDSMPLPDKLKDLLLESIYPVPSDGLFVPSSKPLAVAVACPRQDVVQVLHKAGASRELNYVACVGGPRRQGKSFGNSCAQVDAISLLEGQDNQPAPRSQYVFYLSCLDFAPQPTTAEQRLLLATLVYLRIPALFDEFSNWSYLPAAFEGFLSGPLLHPNLVSSLRPLHFILQDSSLSFVRDVMGGQGVLYGRTNVGVLPLVNMPQPTIHHVAGILKAHHPSMYPSSLLRIMSTHGRSLHELASKPQLPLLELGSVAMADLTMVKGSHLSVLTRVMTTGSAQISKLKEGAGEALQLVEAGYLDVEPQDSDSVVLSDPVMFTRKAVQSAISGIRPSGRTTTKGKKGPKADADAESQYQAAAERQLEFAEGKVLELMARKDLAGNILEKLGLAGKGRYYLWWGWLGPAELDALIYFEEGPVVLVSSKRSQAEQSEAAFTTHINLLQGYVKKRLSSSKGSSSGKDVPLDDSLAAGIAILEALTTPGSELIMVGLSAIPSPNHRLNIKSHIDIEGVDGQWCQVTCRYEPMLLEEVVQPVPCELVTQAMPLNMIAPRQ